MANRTFIAAGNWKLHHDLKPAAAFAQQVVEAASSIGKAEVIIAPTYLALDRVGQIVKGSKVGLAAQNLYPSDNGAFTGEVSAPGLLECGCSHAIIGHSERRTLFGEENTFLNDKLHYAVLAGLTPIFCVGETLEQREDGLVEEVLEEQLKQGLAGITEEAVQKTIIAYEPVWAIGTGKTATPDDAQAAHAFVRKVLTDLTDQSTADAVRILYGGSVKPANVAELIACKDIDGALVGGASLEISTFEPIMKAIDEAMG